MTKKSTLFLLFIILAGLSVHAQLGGRKFFEGHLQYSNVDIPKYEAKGPQQYPLTFDLYLKDKRMCFIREFYKWTDSYIILPDSGIAYETDGRNGRVFKLPITEYAVKPMGRSVREVIQYGDTFYIDSIKCSKMLVISDISAGVVYDTLYMTNEIQLNVEPYVYQKLMMFPFMDVPHGGTLVKDVMDGPTIKRITKLELVEPTTPKETYFLPK